MSFWWFTRDRQGKRHLWLIDTDPMAVTIVMALLVALVAVILLQDPSTALLLAVVLLFSGLACLIISKIPLYRQGVRFSFGCGLMSRGCARLYKVACVLMGAGALLVLLLLNAPRGAC